MPNYRNYFAIDEVSLGSEGAPGSGYRPAHGVQSVATTTTFNLEQVFELGQLDVYENIEDLPAIEMTIEKLLDGYPLVYHLATPSALNKSLIARTNTRCDVMLSLFSDSQDNASGVPLTAVYTSGMYVNTLNYTLPVQGGARESVTLVGNDKVWKTSAFAFNGHFTGNDSPASGIQRRQHVKMGNAAAGGSVWPTLIPGMTVVAGSGYNVESAGVFGAHLQDVTISCNLGRTDLLELGRKRPYFRYQTLPIDVDCVINVIPAGTTPGDMVNAVADSNSNLTNEPILINLADGTCFNLGNKNKLQSCNFSVDVGGGVATMSYTFRNQNKLDVTSPSDPAGLI